MAPFIYIILFACAILFRISTSNDRTEIIIVHNIVIKFKTLNPPTPPPPPKKKKTTTFIR